MKWLSFPILLSLMMPFVSMAKTTATPLNKVVAIVNDDVITNAELERQVVMMKKQLEATNAPLPSDKQLRQQILGRMIDVELQLQVAKKAGVKVKEEDLNKAIQKIVASNNADMDTLKKSLQAQGISYNEFRENIRREMTMAELQQRYLGRDIVITDEQVRSFIKNNKDQLSEALQYNLGDILVSLPEEPTATQLQTAKAKANELIAKLKKGANFHTLAIAESGDSGALQAGDLGWRSVAALPPVFAKEVTKMKTGELSQPIRTPNGFHILKLIDVRGGSNAAMTEQKVRALIYRQRLTQAAESYTQQLRAKSYVKMFTA